MWRKLPQRRSLPPGNFFGNGRASSPQLCIYNICTPPSGAICEFIHAFGRHRDRSSAARICPQPPKGTPFGNSFWKTASSRRTASGNSSRWRSRAALPSSISDRPITPCLQSMMTIFFHGCRSRGVGACGGRINLYFRVDPESTCLVAWFEFQHYLNFKLWRSKSQGAELRSG